jgi:formate-dependent nitrite reductase membrane component NrfD
MSDAAVTRKGLEGVRPGREARMWSGVDGDRSRAPRTDHAPGSYYGNSIINPPVWGELDIAGYLFAGGLAGASSLLATGADLTGRPRLARRAKLCASTAIGASLAALIHDLGRPARFVNMLRVFKPTSPMSVGVWILSAYAPLNVASSASELTGIAPRTGRAAGAGAGLLGAAVATYTAALIADTAVPAWHEGHRELPFLFVGSAASAGAGFGLLAAPLTENAPAQRLAVVGAVAELVADQLLERRLGMVAETMHTGTAGRRLKAARALTVAGALGAATVARRHRVAAALTGGALLAGSALTRFGIFAAGMASAQDPKYTVDPQRARLAREGTVSARC